VTQACTWAEQLAGPAGAAAAERAAFTGYPTAEATTAMQITPPTTATAVKALCRATHELAGARRDPGPGWRSTGNGP
jgi:hypothetical protein